MQYGSYKINQYVLFLAKSLWKRMLSLICKYVFIGVYYILIKCGLTYRHIILLYLFKYVLYIFYSGIMYLVLLMYIYLYCICRTVAT